jgi:hypothetical protein
MLIINTKKYDPEKIPEGVWFSYADGVRVKIRKLTGDVMKELRKPFVRLEMEYNPMSRRMEQSEKIDTEKYDEALSAYIMEEWEGFGDENGNILQNTPESRRAIINIPALREFIWEAATSLDIIAAAKNEEDLKN